MWLIINGQKEETQATTLDALLAERKLNSAAIVTELNGIIVQKELYASTSLQENDRLELVQFVGGG